MSRIRCEYCFGTGRKTTRYPNAIVSTEKEHCPFCEDGYVDDTEIAPLRERIAELEAAIESAIATAETLLDEPSPYNKVGESIAGWLRRALAKKAGGNE
jgi:hypothetical protein